eukprot:Ihof_evm2s868 gene=Ihof_evmTU2s868
MATTPSPSPSNSEVVNQAVKGLCEDYAGYSIVDGRDQLTALEASTNEYATILRACGQMTRESTLLALTTQKTTLLTLHQQGASLKDLYRRIDNLEGYVRMVRQHLDAMTLALEGEEGKDSTVWSYIGFKAPLPPRHKVPPVFNTASFFPHSEADIEGEPSDKP